MSRLAHSISAGILVSLVYGKLFRLKQRFLAMKSFRARFATAQGTLVRVSAAFLLVMASVLTACSRATSSARTRPELPPVGSVRVGLPDAGIAYAHCGAYAPVGAGALMIFSNAAPQYGTLDAVKGPPLRLCVDSVERGQALGINGAPYPRDATFSAGSSTPMPFSSTPQTLVVVRGNDSTVLASAEVTFPPEQQASYAEARYTVMLTQRGDKHGLIFLPHTVSLAPPDSTKFRLVNAAPDAGKVDVYVTPAVAGATTQRLAASNIAFEMASHYVTYPAGVTEILVTPTGHPETVLYKESWQMPPRAAWSIILMNYHDGAGGSRLITNSPMDRSEEPPPIVEDPAFCRGAVNNPDLSKPWASLEFLAAAPRYASVNVCVSDGPKAEGLQYLNGRGWPVTSSALPHTLVVTPTGDSTVLASIPVTLADSARYRVVFTQHTTGGGLIVLRDTVMVVPPTHWSRRFVNAMPNAGAVDIYVTTGSTNLTGLTPMVSNLAFEASSSHITYPAGPARFIVTAAGQPGAVLFAGEDGLTEGGQAMTAILLPQPETGRPVLSWHGN